MAAHEGTGEALIAAVNAAPRAMVILTVPWSGPERAARADFRKAVARLAEVGMPVEAFAVDEESDVSRHWVGSLGLPAPYDGSGIPQGWGAVLWLESGRVVGWVGRGSDERAAGLIARSKALWPAPAAAGGGAGGINPSRGPEADLPPDLLLWRRVSGFVPWWAWVAAAAVQVATILPFWLYSRPAPYHPIWGCVYRGWPAVYGLDQGDVGGDEWGPFTTSFDRRRFALDTAIGLGCGLPLASLVLWLGRRARRPRGPAEPVAAAGRQVGGGLQGACGRGPRAATPAAAGLVVRRSDSFSR